MKKIATLSLLLVLSTLARAQQPPWKSPLQMAWSTDGKTFGSTTIFQDSSGVPCVVRWKGDTLICAFQWFRLPQNSPSWDRVAVKFSYDAGLSWTAPTPIVVNGLPANYQRPFDPTLAVFGGDSLRLYFSSSDGMPSGGLTEIVNCYSAKSHDGVHYHFEPNARVDHPSKPLIDPAVIFFNNAWHYTAPAGAPQDGAHHFISPDGLTFSPLVPIPSDNSHNWTGNMMLKEANELRFYGSGPYIWYNSTANGTQWNGFVNTNIQGGDPSVLKVSANSYLMVYVGKPYTTGTTLATQAEWALYPNPASNLLQLGPEALGMDFDYTIFDLDGKPIRQGRCTDGAISLDDICAGPYFLKLQSEDGGKLLRFIKI